MMVPRQSAELNMIIPVFNETEAVRGCFEEVCRALEPLDVRCSVLFVDDGSRDGTALALSQLGAMRVGNERNAV